MIGSAIIDYEQKHDERRGDALLTPSGWFHQLVASAAFGHGLKRCVFIILGNINLRIVFKRGLI